jgi:hypothetical protein
MASASGDLGLTELLAAAGCKPLRRGWHALRHTFASLFMQSGGELFALSKLLGHADVRETQVYAHLSPDYLAAAREPDVRRLDVAVDDAGLLERLAQGLGDRLGDLQRPGDRQRRPLLEVGLERLAIDVLHDDEEVAGRLAAVEDADDARRGEPGGEARLAEEALGDAGLLAEVRVEELDGDVEVEVAVAALVDDAHAALAEAAFELAPADAGQS